MKHGKTTGFSVLNHNSGEPLQSITGNASGLELQAAVFWHDDVKSH